MNKLLLVTFGNVLVIALFLNFSNRPIPDVRRTLDPIISEFDREEVVITRAAIQAALRHTSVPAPLKPEDFADQTLSASSSASNPENAHMVSSAVVARTETVDIEVGFG